MHLVSGPCPNGRGQSYLWFVVESTQFPSLHDTWPKSLHCAFDYHSVPADEGTYFIFYDPWMCPKIYYHMETNLSIFSPIVPEEVLSGWIQKGEDV